MRPAPNAQPPIAPGAHIELRDAVWRVIRVDPTSTGGHAWHVEGVSELVRDQPALFLSDLEPDVTVLDPRHTQLERDTSSMHRDGLLYMESRLREVPPADDAIHVGHEAAMDPMDFQLRPAWKALKRPRQRILIADTVGLGKTLEAGILLSELARRGRARRILVCTMKSMLTQFQKELWCRFSLPLVRLDSVGLHRIRSRIPTHHNPFYHFDRVIISIDTLKQNNAFRTHVEAAHWDVVVIDEAHNVAKRGSGNLRHEIAQVLAHNCDSLVLLSATPHDGKAESFASLVNLLDPTAIADPTDYDKADVEHLYVRRFKASPEVKAQLGDGFPPRQVMRAHVDASPAEERAFEHLAGLDFVADQGARSGHLLLKTALEKALFSSPAACAETIANRIKRLQARKDPERFSGDVAQLRAFLGAVQAVGPAQFSRYQRLLAALDNENELDWSGRDKEDRLVIFTERRPTLRFLAERLSKDLNLGKGAVLTLDGDMSDVEQAKVVEAFGQESSPVRVLIATDVASEGLNLHYLCCKLVHFDVPWSLMVFQQRNGRVDRYGQKRTPLIAYLFTEPRHPKVKGDVRILELLTERDEQAQKNIHDPAALALTRATQEEEEALTAGAIEEGLEVPAWLAALKAQGLDDSLVAQLAAPAGEGAGDADGSGQNATPEPLPPPVPRGSTPSLFGSDFAFAAAAADRERALHGLRASADPVRQLLELHLTKGLSRRFERLPQEVRPGDGVVLHTASRSRMKEAMEDARKAKDGDPWPRHQYLWRLNPVVEWLSDRVGAAFGRHTAPVLVGTQGLEPGAFAVIVSSQLTNRQARPLWQRWTAVRFERLGAAPTLQPFEEAKQALGLRWGALPGDEAALDTDALATALPAAIDAVAAWLARERQPFEDELDARLAEETARLRTLQDRQLDWVEDALGAAHLASKRHAERARVAKVFADHERWVKDVMTPSPTPFFEVVAVIARPGPGIAGGGS